MAVRAWERKATGVGGAGVPVYFLDTDLPENAADDRTLTHFLYGGDMPYRLAQEIVLGIGGVRMLRALGARADRSIPSERRSFGAARHGAAGGAASRVGALNAEHRRRGDRAAAVCLHDAHAGTGGP